MRTLIPIIVFALVLAVMSENMSRFKENKYGCREYVRKDMIVYMFLALGMAIFVGLRTQGNDTHVYRQMYEELTGGIFSINWLKLSDAPGLQFVCTILKRLGATTQDYLMIMALFTVCTYLWFIRKYTSNIVLSIYYFITMGVYTFTMAAIKQTTAVAILLIATDRAINKKWLQFIILVGIAELFHPYSFIYLIIPFLFFKPWSSQTYILCIGTVVVALALEKLMGNIFAMTETLGYGNYGVNEFSGDGVNIFRVAVVWVPLILSFLGQKYLDKENRANNLILNATMINALIMFIGLFGTANYFARLANYFLIFQTLSLPWLFHVFTKKGKRIITELSMVAYFIYFYYQSVLAQGRFDSVYSFLRFTDYLRQL